METTTPFVGVIAPYGSSYFLGLSHKSVIQKKRPFVIVDSEEAAAVFAHTFRLKYPGVKVSTISKTDAQIYFVSQTSFLHYLLDQFKKKIPEKIDFTGHIYYMLPNMIPYHMTAYVILRTLEEVFFRGTQIPNVTIFGVNTQNFPQIKSNFTIFNKNSQDITVNYQLYGKNLPPEILYKEMAKLILRLHMETPGKNIVAILPTKNEIETLNGILQKIEVPNLYIYDIYEGGEWKIDPTRTDFTTLYPVTNELEPLVMVPIDIVIDSFRILQPGRLMSGESTSVATTTTKDVSLGRCSILQSRHLHGKHFQPISQKAGTCYIMTNKLEFERKKFVPQSITPYLLLLGKTQISQMDIFPDHSYIQTELITLQSYGALNPDYRTTAIGDFLIDIPLSAGEGTVLWRYLQEHWVLGSSCLPALITTSMISLFSEEDPYYIYPPIKIAETGDYYYERSKHRREKWSIFAGSDDLETFLNIWFRIVTDLNTFTPNIDDLIFWSRNYSLNGKRLSRVLERIKLLKDVIQKYGFVCEKDTIEPKKDMVVLRPIYSQVYLLKHMKVIDEDEPIYQSLSDQQLYTVYSPLSINTTSVTVPPQIIAPITSDLEIFVVVIYR